MTMINTHARGSALFVALLFAGCSSDPGEPERQEPEIQSGTLIQIPDGQLQGAIDGGSRRFLGIPFAKPPIGELRWKAPRKNEAWEGVRDATQFSGRCAQLPGFFGEGSENEDCLYLNVWAPEQAPSEPLPVMVWFHGGSNVSGSTSDLSPLGGGQLYDGRKLASELGVVVVTANYRLGALGFFAHPSLSDEGSPLGNQALLDQQQTLEWVQTNIRAFGGDSRNVTIFGHSAGALDVCFQVATSGKNPRFHRAISQSGGAFSCTTRVKTAAEAAHESQAFTQEMGCDGATDQLACLRQKPVGELIVAAPIDGAPAEPLPGGEYFQGSTPRWTFEPIVDGELVRDQPRNLFDAGDIARVPYLLGTTNDEVGIVKLAGTGSVLVATEADYLAALDRRFGIQASAVAARYPVASFASPEAALIRLATDWIFTCATVDTARRAANAGLDVYLYNFEFAAPGLEFAGAFHGLDVRFVFGTAEPKTEAGVRLRDVMQGYWTRLARTGDPNGEPAPAWPRFEIASERRMTIAPEPAAVDGFRVEECAMWQSVYDAEFQ
jgi:para-nitrobenzyl esterase